MRLGIAVMIALFVASPALAQVLIYDFPLDEDPGWEGEAQWAYGRPNGQGGSGGGGPDPTAGHTGEKIYGYNLYGDYPDNLTPTQWLMTEALDFRGYTNVQLRFWRWLGVEDSRYDNAWIQVSNDGANWTTVWHNSAG